MKKIILGVIAGVMLLASCKKEDSTPNNNNGGNNNGNSIDYTRDIVGVYTHHDTCVANLCDYTIDVSKINDKCISLYIDRTTYHELTLESENMTSTTHFTVKEWDGQYLCDYDLDPGCHSSFFRYSGYGTLSGNTIAIHIDKNYYSDMNRTHLVNTMPYMDYNGIR